MGKTGDAVPKWATILVLVLAFAVFAPSMGNGFALDDAPLASGRWALQPGEPDPVIGTLHSPGFYFSKFYWYMEYVNDGLYRPLTIYSYALTYNLVSANFFSAANEAVPHHVLNVLLHVLATWLVLRLLLRIGLPGIGAHVGAGLFAVHAIHSEVVAGVVGRAELLAFVGGLGGILAFARGMMLVGAARVATWLGAAALFFVGYCGKESALAFAPLLGCFLAVRAWQASSPVRSQPWLPAGLVALLPMGLFLLLRRAAIAQHPVEMIDFVANPLWSVDGMTRFCTAVKLWGYGLWQCVFPFDLSASYSANVFTLAQTPADVGFLAALLVLGSGLALGIWSARRQPVVFFSVAAFFGMGFITSNVPFATGTIYAERLYYAPSLGVCMLGAWAGSRWGLPKWLWLGLIGWCVCSVTTIFGRNGAWQDSETLFLLEARNQPMSADMQVKAAGVLRRAGGPGSEAQARSHIEAALALVPDYPSALREKGALQLRRGDWDAALDTYSRAWRSPYRELPSTRELAVEGIRAALQGKGVSIDSVDLEAPLRRAVRGLARPVR